jgi:recombinational DNA repair protein RecT
MKDGDPEFRFMWKHEVDLIRSRSRAKDSGPWVTDYEAMAWKTVIRRLCKYLPRTVELARALDMDERVDAGIEQNLEDSFGVTIDAEPVAEQKTGLDALADKIGAAAATETVNTQTGELSPAHEPLQQPAEPEPLQRPADEPILPIQPRPRGRAAMPAAGDIFDGQKREPGQEG